ncbi:alpha/beta hydrolase [Bacillus cereus]|uniref:alpha/beta hydrolase n=1 Tax=Bacillus cereus TaxID=1396 RepID=UPI001238D659|nr:alpha/beta fold hydrolase [Bacillus cereus]KAA6470413.1 hypothetical protein DX931_28670 [Bacillus cereus]
MMNNEQLVNFNYRGKKIYAVHNHVEKGDSPGVIFLHGLAGDRVDSRRIFVKLARRLQNLGYPSIRFDIIGTGISEGNFHDITLESWYEQVKFLVNEFSNGIFRNRQIILVAFSEAAKIAIKVAQNSAQIKGICLCNGIITDEFWEQDRKINRLYKRDNQFVFDMGFGVWVNTKIIKENDKFKVNNKDHIPNIPILALYGESDVMTLESRKIFENNNLIKLYIIKGSDHLFTTPEWESQLLLYIENWLLNEWKF